ncbi:hypothetical protein A3A68_02370 [Candidatus Saccharibacteria bacterium RIFCSPLOWO2_01_FULL_48_13]|nr:MAG: hypothetical protein A2884_00120 [Candidatus Saccharibacteria bacterium RIFCSPHIGHO2_01_FULL_48_12]OGL36075.1 MAG: hypothetical protein A3F38_00525 [Candidatus Saccharibacteria bacterium RIFCSPHIGHO2_12_FULL_48_21]OGL36766.1 MAG: hypothetical protein A3A68_02370 [Candidatus Saccharibacteria bacterium RIFCSPLOWO2_01_FULL_48_13]
MKNIAPRDRGGSIILPIILILPFLILIATYFMNLSVASYKLAVGDQLRTRAQFAADAGIDLAMQEINQDNNWVGTGSEIELYNNSKVRTTYEITVSDNGASGKALTAIGRSFRPASSVTAEASVKIIVDLQPVQSGSYSIVTGVGGLYLSNSAKIIGGDVLVNGEINMINSSQIGLTTNPVNVQVAHQTCPNPPDATYPRICDPGENGEPISIANPAHIYGSVTANNQINGALMSNPGLVVGPEVPAQPLPPHDRNAQKDAAGATPVSGADASCGNNQTRTWAANTKIVGNVSVTHNCVVTVEGDVWITGTLTMQNSAKLVVADSLLTTRPNIMVDGTKAFLKNSATLQSNSSSTGIRLLNYWSNAACSPDCADLTGLDLYNSRNSVTIELDNTASGPQSIFDSRWTRVLISNSGQIGALVGQTVELRNSGTITFGTTAPTEGSTFWIINGYRRSFD